MGKYLYVKALTHSKDELEQYTPISKEKLELFQPIFEAIEKEKMWFDTNGYSSKVETICLLEEKYSIKPTITNSFIDEYVPFIVTPGIGTAKVVSISLLEVIENTKII